MNTTNLKDKFKSIAAYVTTGLLIVAASNYNAEEMKKIYNPNKEQTKKEQAKEATEAAAQAKAEKASYHYRGFILD